jgi:hypothetical protein
MGTFSYQTEPLDENEAVLGVFYGNRGQVGSQLVVTNRRLLIGPIDTALVTAILSGLGKAVGAGDPVELLNNVLKSYGPMSSLTLWATHVADVQATNGASLFKAPGMRISTDTNQQIDFAVVTSPTSMSINPRNVAARVLAVQTIRTAMQQAKAAGAKPPP